MQKYWVPVRNVEVTPKEGWVVIQGNVPSGNTSLSFYFQSNFVSENAS